jgi:hypothetical protein
MTLQLGGGSYPVAAPRPKPVTLSSALATNYYPSNTVGAAAAGGNYAGIAAAFPSFVAPAPASAPATPWTSAFNAASPSTAGLSSDYASQLAALVQPTADQVSAQSISNAANLTAQRRQAIVQFGAVPADLSGRLSGQLTGDVNADINDETRGLAAEGTRAGVSTYAQLQKAYADKQKSDWANLAARNMVHSGAAGQHASEDQLAYAQGYESSAQKLLDYLQSAYGTYLTAQATGQTALANATSDALKVIIAQIQAGQYQSPTTATQPSGGGDQGGGDQGGYSGVGPTTPAQVTAALNQPGAVNAMGGPAPYANARQSVAPASAPAPKPTAHKVLDPFGVPRVVYY